jgi:TrmH family RNA methyltransferase
MAAGMNEAWCLKGTADVFSDKAIRASAGAVFRLRVREGLSAEYCIKRVRELGAKLFVCEAGGLNLYETQMTGRIAIAVGNESNGPQLELTEAADCVIGVPMAKESESLNAATAVAIVMYEALRQYRGIN